MKFSGDLERKLIKYSDYLIHEFHTEDFKINSMSKINIYLD